MEKTADFNQGARTSAPGRLASGWYAGLIFLVTLAAYWPSVRGGFIWDDDAHVTKPDLRSLHGLKRIWFELGATQQYYPVLHSAFWVEHRWWGDAVIGYHLANILLHATAAFLFGLVLQRLWVGRVVPDTLSGVSGRTSVSGTTRPTFFGAPLVAALIFALHPVCVESVAWISEQKNTLSTVFYLLAALAFLTWHGRPVFAAATASEDRRVRSSRSASEGGPHIGWYVLALALFILAVLSKSVTATLPAALLVVLWWKRGSLSWKRDFLPLLPFFAIGIAAGLFTAWVERRYIGAQGAAFDLNLVERCLLAGRVIWFYLAKLFWPANLMFVYPHWHVNAGGGWQWLFPLGAVALLAALWSIRRRTRGPLAGMLFFVGSLFPALGFFNVYPFIYSYVADHFQYLAMMGIVALVASVFIPLNAGLRRDSLRPLLRWRRLAGASTLGALALLCVLGTLTWRQCRSYRDIETLYRTTLEKNPGSWMAHYNLGVVLGRAGRLPEAIAEYERAIELKPGMTEIHSDLGTAFIRAGRVAEAIDQFQMAVRLKPGYADAHLNLSAALKQSGRVAEAIAEGEETLRLRPEFPEASYNLGLIFQEAGRLPEAIAQFDRVLALRPDFPGARLNLANARDDLGVALAGEGRLSEAVVQFREVLRLNPDNAEAQSNLGSALAGENQLAEALAAFREALRIEPDNARTHYNLGLVFQAMGRAQEAKAQFDESARLQHPN